MMTDGVKHHALDHQPGPVQYLNGAVLRIGRHKSVSVSVEVFASELTGDGRYYHIPMSWGCRAIDNQEVPIENARTFHRVPRYPTAEGGRGMLDQLFQ